MHCHPRVPITRGAAFVRRLKPVSASVVRLLRAISWAARLMPSLSHRRSHHLARAGTLCTPLHGATPMSRRLILTLAAVSLVAAACANPAGSSAEQQNRPRVAHDEAAAPGGNMMGGGS
jgi:hypothetical protein